ncbi:MAG TPA: ATP-binding protein [Chryseosolibacter sp.]|nr:ATP-binding protein [Chryseosolibacter sp.]
MKVPILKNIVFVIVCVISILLVTNVVLTYYNNQIIKRNQDIQSQVEQVRLYYDQIGKSIIHSLDIGLRGYFIERTPAFVAPMDNAINLKDSLLTSLELPLTQLNYHDSAYTIFKDSLDAYTEYTFMLKDLLIENRDQEFKNIFKADKGAHLWWQYEQVENNIKQHINRLDTEAQNKYESALQRNQVIQFVILIICVPTLLFTAFYTSKAFKLSEMVRNAEEEKNKILSEQNQMLEHKVAKRTQEIVTQNQEITSQNEELRMHQETLSMQNKQLQEAEKTIREQSQKIQSLNDHLKIEVDNRTQELQKTNKELIEHNNQLEQFAFIAAHNLRAPLVRVLGLANLIQMGESEEDKRAALEKMICAAHDLDQVVKDLNAILNIKRHTGNFAEVDLNESLTRTKRILEKEIEDTGTRIIHNFSEADRVYAIAPYVESILYNLISNAIKYRDPVRAPYIAIKTTHEQDFVCLAVMDNGLGIDLRKYKQNIFSLYKRFHLHVEGKGLGLYLVKTQIEALGGRVDVRSEPNEGTTFHVYFKRYLI